ncbi:phage integrase N-terminal SAM-like domain-containing protein, partial [Proteus mirabilis]
MSNSPFLNSIRTDMRQKGYALKTEKTYLHWIKRFILFHKKRHPQTMGSEEVRLFLSSLANSRHVAINTQKIALNALAFLYNRFLQQPLGDIDYIPASKPRRLPSVISANEEQRILQALDTRNQVIFNLRYCACFGITKSLGFRVTYFYFYNGYIP